MPGIKIKKYSEVFILMENFDSLIYEDLDSQWIIGAC